MKILEGKPLVDALRSATDRARARLWIASPFIGSWPGNVRRIIGTNWHQGVKDVRLMTDISANGYHLSTLRQFFRRGLVRSLAGLHVKLYIADDFVLLTSANLTGTAFSRRYEAGVVLTGQLAKRARQLFESWWANAGPVDEKRVPTPKGHTTDSDHRPGPSLKVRVKLPDDAEDEPLPDDSFGDYDVFLRCFKDLAREYSAVQRIWTKAPRYFEVDGFLNYLYHDAPGRPSQVYAKKPPRHLTATARRQQIKKFARMFAKAYRNEDIGDEPGWRSEAATEVRRLLDRNRHRGLSRSEAKQLLLQTNAMKSYQVNLATVLNPANNEISEIRHALRALIDEQIELQPRMSKCSQRVFGLGKAAVQELVGFYYKGKYPLRNRNTNCGLRFLGYEVRVN